MTEPTENEKALVEANRALLTQIHELREDNSWLYKSLMCARSNEGWMHKEREQNEWLIELYGQ